MSASILFEASAFSVNAYVRGRAVTILGPLDIRIRPGEHIALIGKTGSGKSTLLLAMAGLLAPGLWTHGRLEVMGRPRSSHEMAKLRSQRIAYVPQNPIGALSDRRTIGKVFDRMAKLHHLPVERERWACDLEAMGLPCDAIWERKASSFSGGETQRMLFYLFTMTGADVFLFDEITSALDPATQEKMRALRRSLLAASARPITEITVTHHYGDLDRYDRVIRLESGHIAGDTLTGGRV